MNIHLIPNIIALVLSLVAVVMLLQLTAKMRGGQLASVMNWMLMGIVFAVAIHAAAEMGELLGLLPEGILFYIMGTLLSLGSLCFIIAGIKARKIFI